MTQSSDQYRIIASGAGWIEKTWRGRLRVEGRDAASFLHALLTNDVASLAPGDGVYAAYLTPQGRMLADVVVYRLTEFLALDVPRAEAARLADRLDQLVFAEDVRISDDSPNVVQFAIVGEGAARAAATAVGAAEHDVSTLRVHGHLLSSGRLVARSDEVDGPAFDLTCLAEDQAAVIDALEAAGAQPIDEETFEAMRIEARHPKFGVDMTAETIPLEAGLVERAISLTKGCYVGQEVIVRVMHRGGGRVAKRLIAVSASDEGEPLAPGVPISVGGAIVGHITSAAHSLRRGRSVALGYVRREAAEAGGPFFAGGTELELLGLAG